MCGIVGYKGFKKASKILLDSVRRLEYRGYDSVGMAVLGESGIIVKKGAGNVDKVNNELFFEELEGSIGVAHTRWATTGEVNNVNSHPHLSNNNKICVVHNGIVENYQEIKKFLENKGFCFISQTDTEVIPNYVQYFIDNGESFEDAVKKTLRIIKGSFAVVIMSEDDGIIIGARRGSPLVLGIGFGEFFLASDVPAFSECTDKVVYLDDDEFAVLGDDYHIYDFNTGRENFKKINIINWSFEQAKKGEYEHFMLKEINEQGNTIKKAAEQSIELIREATDLINGACGVFLVGCGTSYHACVSASYIFSKIAKKHVNVLLASEFRNYEHFLSSNTLVIAVSQSGETADVIDAVSFAKKHGCRTLSIVNVMGSTLTRLCSLNIMMNAGPEICVLSTKSYTSQLAVLTLLAYSAVDKFKQAKKLLVDVAGKVNDLINNINDDLKLLAGKLKRVNDLFLIGRDLAYPSALEGALKIKEVSYIHAEGFAGAELKHGTMALIQDGVPVIALNTRGTNDLLVNNIMEVKARGAFVIGIDSRNNELYDFFIKVPGADIADPALMIIPIQLLAYYLALAKNLNPDQPRNLAKSVTVK